MASSSNYLIYAECPNSQFPYMKLHITLEKTGLSDSLISCHNLILAPYQAKGRRLLVQWNKTTQN